MPVERCRAGGRDEPAVVGSHQYVEAEVAVVAHEQGNVAKGMVLAAARGTEVGEASQPAGHAVARSLCQVVVLLLADLYQALAQVVGHGVAVAHDGVALGPVAGSPVATDNVASLAQQSQRLVGRGERAVGQNHSVKPGHTW